MWHRDLPADTDRDVLDIIAKALMIRLGASVTMSQDEMRAAAATQAEFNLEADGSVSFRVERQ